MAYWPVEEVHTLEDGLAVSSEEDCAMLARKRQKSLKREGKLRNMFLPHEYAGKHQIP